MSDQNLYIHSIYPATEGEGVLIGTPQVFVRFQGCNIGCINCDSRETWDFKTGGTSYTLNQTLDLIHKQAKKLKRVSITGGDPMHPMHLPKVKELTKALVADGYQVNIEASGTRVDDELFELVSFISFDYKTPSTGVKTPIAHLIHLITTYPGKYQIKSVVEHSEDYQYISKAYQRIFKQLSIHPVWVITPSFVPGTSFNRDLIKDTYEWNNDEGGTFRIIPQQHKIIYGTESLLV